MNVLVSSAGRRGALIRLIRDTVEPMKGRVFAVDVAPWSSACRLADEWSLVPPFDDDRYFDAVVSFCQQHAIRLIIPTHDRELPIYARLRPLFSELGITVVCSGPETVSLASDKAKTDDFLTTNGLPTVTRIPLAQARCPQSSLPFPLVVKPRQGSGSEGVHIVQDEEELAFYLQRTPSPIVQRRACGREFTTNLFVGRDRKCLVAVPHWRVETRGGEVSKSVTVRQPQLLDLAERIAGTLPDAYGPLCFQAFVTDEGETPIIELNARFGGGYPLAHEAGANFVRLLVDDVLGRPATQPQWNAGLAMTRWDDAVFWEIREKQQCA